MSLNGAVWMKRTQPQHVWQMLSRRSYGKRSVNLRWKATSLIPRVCTRNKDSSAGTRCSQGEENGA